MNIQISTSIPPKQLPVIQLVTSDASPPVGFSRTEFSGKAGSLAVIPDQPRRIFVGVGAKGGIQGAAVARALGVAVRHLQAAGFPEAVLDLRGYEAWASQAAEGAVIGSYVFDTFVPLSRRVVTRLRKLVVQCEASAKTAVTKAVKEGVVIGESVNFTRSLGDLPGNYIQPETLAQAAQEMAEECGGLRVKIWRESELRKRGFGGLLAVGGGSAHPPRLIQLDYRGDLRDKTFTALVGKAITFDSGGISIKPSEKMDEMKFDKMGGCSMLGVMRAVALLRPKINVTALVACAENLPGPNAYRPGDIVTTYTGKTVEVLNTDAEGRIVLADAIGYAAELKAARIVDMATLTGAVMVALGSHRAGLFASDEALASEILAASQNAGEPLWQLPCDEPYAEQIQSAVADLKNTGGRFGGACTAAAFLRAWTEGIPWAHLDIAGVMHHEKDKSHQAAGASAFGVRTLIGWLRQKADSAT